MVWWELEEPIVNQFHQRSYHWRVHSKMQTRKDREWELALSQVAVWKMMRIGLEEEKNKRAGTLLKESCPTRWVTRAGWKQTFMSCKEGTSVLGGEPLVMDMNQDTTKPYFHITSDSISQPTITPLGVRVIYVKWWSPLTTIHGPAPSPVVLCASLVWTRSSINASCIIIIIMEEGIIYPWLRWLLFLEKSEMYCSYCQPLASFFLLSIIPSLLLGRKRKKSSNSL